MDGDHLLVETLKAVEASVSSLLPSRCPHVAYVADVVMTAVVGAWLKYDAGELVIDVSFKAYARGITRKQIASHLRNCWRASAWEEWMDNVASNEPSGDPTSAEFAVDYNKQLAELERHDPDAYRVFRIRIATGDTFKAIGERLGRHTTWAHDQYRKAQEFLRVPLRDYRPTWKPGEDEDVQGPGP